jgi:hypothetical protein
VSGAKILPYKNPGCNNSESIGEWFQPGDLAGQGFSGRLRARLFFSPAYCLVCFFIPTIRNVENILPDHDQAGAK